MTKKELQEYVRNLEDAFIDTLTPNSNWQGIWLNTGLPKARCKEISELYDHAVNRYHQRRFNG